MKTISNNNGKPEVILAGIEHSLRQSKRDFSLGKGKITKKQDAFSATTDEVITNEMLSD